MEEMLRTDGYVCVFANLKPRKLGPIMSNGMVMCASNADHTAIELVRPPAGSKLGERIMLEGNPIGETFSQEPCSVLNPKKKIAEKFLPLLKTNANSEATFNGIKLVTNGGVLKATSLKNCGIS